MVQQTSLGLIVCKRDQRENYVKLTGNNKGVKIGSFAAKPPKGTQARASMLATVTNALSQPTDPDFNPEATFESSQGDIGDVLSDEARKPKRKSFAAFRSLLAQAKAETPQQQQQQATQEKTQQQQQGKTEQQVQQKFENPNEKATQRRSADAAQAGGQPLKNEKSDKKKSTGRRGSASTSSAKSSTASSFTAAANTGFVEAEVPEGQLQQGQNEEAQESKNKKTTRGKTQGPNARGQAPAGQTQQQAAPKKLIGAAFMKPGEGAEQVQKQNAANPTDQKAQLRNAEAAKTSGSAAFTQSAKKATKGTSAADRNSNSAFDEVEGEEDGFVDTRNFLMMRNMYKSFSETERRISISNRGHNAGYSPWGEAARQVALSF